MTKTAYSRDLGGWMRLQRRAAGVKQADVAVAIGVTATTISRWEAGTRTPDAYQHALLRGYFGAQKPVKAAR